MRKRWWIIPILIVLVFIVLNPSMKQFKEFIGNKDSDGYKRTSNYLVYSVFEYDNEKYLGILSNFYLRKKISEIAAIAPTSDTATVVTDTIVIIANDIENSYVSIVYHSLKANTHYTHGQLISHNYTVNEIKKMLVNGKITKISIDDLMANPKMVLWAGLGDRDLYTKSFEEFVVQYSDVTSISKLYNSLFDDGLYSKSEKEFYSKYFPEVTPPK